MRRTLKNVAVSLAAVAVTAMTTISAQAAMVVHVKLWDKGADTQMTTGLEYAMPGADLSKATMGVRAIPTAVKAGKVTFEVTNTSKDTIHEMIVMYLKDPSKPLPYIKSQNRVNEDKAGDMGEVSELDPGTSGSLTVDLKAGHYLLICNVPGHYASGMWTKFTVIK